MTLTDAITTRFYASYNSIDQQLPGALTYDGALTTPRRANAASVAGDQARDIDSLRLQNRTSFDFGAAKLDVGVFVSVKTLHHPIYQLIDQKSVDRGGYFRFDYAGGPVEATLGGELRVGDVHSRRFVNVAGRRGARTFDARQDRSEEHPHGQLRPKPPERKRGR